MMAWDVDSCWNTVMVSEIGFNLTQLDNIYCVVAAKMVDVTGSSGLISSPLYPKFDVNDDDQMYRIIVSLGQVVSVVIEDLVVRSGSILTVNATNYMVLS